MLTGAVVGFTIWAVFLIVAINDNRNGGPEINWEPVLPLMFFFTGMGGVIGWVIKLVWSCLVSVTSLVF